MKRTNATSLAFPDAVEYTELKINVLHWSSYLMPKTRSRRNPPKKQSTTLGHEYQAYSCMNFDVFRFRSFREHQPF